MDQNDNPTRRRTGVPASAIGGADATFGATDTTASSAGSAIGAQRSIATPPRPSAPALPQSGTRGIADRIRESATAQLSTQKDRATDGIGSVAQAVRGTTQQLREQQHETVARYVEQAADQLEKFSTTLKEKDVSELMRDAQALARRQPALFIGAAFAVGLVGARFLKSSADNTNPQGVRDYRPAESWR
jgi:HAMP domain-containing protein